MNAILWILQVLTAFVTAAGALWRYKNYDQAARAIPSLAALPKPVWGAVNVFELACAAGLILPGLIKATRRMTAVAAGALAIEMLLVTALHAKYYGIHPSPANPATWSFALAILSTLIAIGRNRGLDDTAVRPGRIRRTSGSSGSARPRGRRPICRWRPSVRCASRRTPPLASCSSRPRRPVGTP